MNIVSALGRVGVGCVVTTAIAHAKAIKIAGYHEGYCVV